MISLHMYFYIDASCHPPIAGGSKDFGIDFKRGLMKIEIKGET